MFLILIAIGWLYVALMMAVVEASSPVGSVLGASITFLLYGLGPVALVLYILGTPARRKLRRLREAQPEAAARAVPSHAPDAGGQPAADAVAPVGKEPCALRDRAPP
jgi:hypothetical protein